MMQNSHSLHGFASTLIAGVLAAGVAGCTGDDGAQGPAGTTGVPVVSASTVTALNIAVTNVTVASPPVVTFKVTNEIGLAVVGLKLADFRFTIAKLVPGTAGDPSAWQSYINTTASAASGTPGQGTTAIQATTEGSGSFTGTFSDNGDGTYTYTFKTDIANVTAPLAVSYDPTLTHRIGIQTRGTVPIVNVVHTFRPSDGATTGIFLRDIVKTENCNECHNKLALHGGSRVETKFCVTCHNPGSKDPDSLNTVNFTEMIHKIHMGEELPSVKGADGVFGTGDDGKYQIIGFGGTVHDFSTVVFPMGGPTKAVGELRHCTKCHDGADTATPQGDNWKTPNMAACGACHDNVNFATGANHSGSLGTGGVQTDNSQCATCHSATGIAGTVESSHEFPSKAIAESKKFQFNIDTVSNTGPGSSPVIDFYISDPTNGNTRYNLKTDTRLSAGSVSLAVGWNNADENNTGSTSNPALPLTVSLTGTGAANAQDLGSNLYRVDLATATLGNGVTNRVIPIGTTGSGRVAIYGRAAVELNAKTAGAERVRIKAAFKDFPITDPANAPVARRKVVDIAKCDKCHEQLSLHGDSRTDEPGVCVMCHNPNMTDVNRRPKISGGADNGFPNAAVTKDGKREESVDFKRMIHGIHAGAKKDYLGIAAHGKREKGLVIYGFGSAAVDFSHVRFPGILSDCTTCHTTTTVNGATYGTYELVGKWEVPTASGILGSSILTAPSLPSLVGGAPTYAAQLADQSDDINITPTASVCSACHDGQVAQSHMQLNGALFAATQATINTGVTLEACAICHGPGRVADVKVMHKIK